jgi:tetratricopeptide (TPR) repeat protein
MTRKRDRPAGAYHYPGEKLHAQWAKLHRGDCERWPDQQRVATLARDSMAFAEVVRARGGASTVAQQLQQAWREFHAGEFPEAIERGATLGALGGSVANKATAVAALYSQRSPAQTVPMLTAAIDRGEEAVAQLSDYPNAHYMLALVIGRYSQRISILKALSRGLAGRVRSHLQKTLELEPRHAEAHVAFGLYHAEIVGQLGALAASLTYGASGEAALDHFRRATHLAPNSAIVHMEHAHGLLRLDADRHREEARSLYERAAACEPLDAMEDLDVARAARGLSGVARRRN